VWGIIRAGKPVPRGARPAPVVAEAAAGRRAAG
jgi:hypothetical protein